MTLFWILAALMIIVAIAILAPTLLRSRKLATNDREAQNIAIARERLAELDTELAEGRISPEEHAKTKVELEQALLQDVEGSSAVSTTPENTRLGKITLAGLVVLVPLLAVTLYLQLGNPQMLTSDAPTTTMSGGDNKQHSMGSLDQMAEKLRQRLEEKSPDDAEGWYLLGRTYSSLKKFDGAAKAYERAYQLTKAKDPVVILSLADALAMQQQGRISGRPAELVAQALAIDPSNTMALWLSGIAAEEKGNFMEALGLWKKLYPMLASEPGEQQALAEQIKRVSAMAGVAPPAMLAQKSPAAGKTTGTTGNTSVKVKVTLSPALQKQVKEGDSVFIYAKAQNGPRFPLAAARRSAAELPLELTLDESSAIMPNTTLANFATVKVGARISHSGNAIAAKGDLIGEVDGVKVGDDKTIEIVIDKIY
jgi:cytochrome c-type biogenesis protein CcmH